MLIEFRFTNFRSFRDEQVFSMVSSADNSLLDNIVTDTALGNLRLNRSAVIYGANAAGKSNLVTALRFVSDFVEASAERIPTSGRSRRKPLFRHQPFLLDPKAREEPSVFEIQFLHEGVRYQYGFSLDSERIIEEWLLAYPKGLPRALFQRNWDGKKYNWHFGKSLHGEKQRFANRIRPNVLFLSLAATSGNEQLESIYEWFTSYLVGVNSGVQLASMHDFTARESRDNPTFKESVLAMLARADFGVNNFQVDEQPFREVYPELLEVIPKSSEVDELMVLDVAMHHPECGADDVTVSLPMEEESLGTRRFFELSGPWIDSLQNGITLFIDELDDSLHPLLVRHLIQMFHNPDINRNGAQLIFNTHDATLLDTRLFRRDQIWFVEKDKNCASHIYSLLNFRPRKGEALERGYLQGRYGAVPFLQSIDEDIVHNAETTS